MTSDERMTNFQMTDEHKRWATVTYSGFDMVIL
jgi:hypothetical protein